MPHILREVLTVYKILRERAQSGVVLPLEEAPVNLTLDTNRAYRTMSLRQDLEERSSTNKPGEYAFQRAKVENQLILTFPPGWSYARSV